MTEEEREDLSTELRGLGKSIERSGDERDTAIAGCLYGLCLAIAVGAEVELARHILGLDGNDGTEMADAAHAANFTPGH
jgi:hypothetical protein